MESKRVVVPRKQKKPTIVTPVPPQPSRSSPKPKPTTIKLDCSACKTEQSMIKTTASRSGGGGFAFGLVLFVLGVFGAAFASLFWLWRVIVIMETAEQTGNQSFIVPGLTIVTTIALILFVVALVVIGVGLMMMRMRNIYLCTNCRFILERA